MTANTSTDCGLVDKPRPHRPGTHVLIEYRNGYHGTVARGLARVGEIISLDCKHKWRRKMCARWLGKCDCASTITGPYAVRAKDPPRLYMPWELIGIEPVQAADDAWIEGVPYRGPERGEGGAS